MEHVAGICKRCGKDLVTNYGDLNRRTSKNMCSSGSLMTEAIQRSNQEIPQYCKRCLKLNRKDKIQKIFGFIRKKS